MLNISEELKNIFKNDRLPYSKSMSYKELILTFTNGTNTITVSNKQIVEDSVALSESLCSTNDLTFGGCESAQFMVTVADVDTDLKGMTLTVIQRINNTYNVPLGVFTVESAKKQADLRFKDIIAYDYCKKLDVDVASWYNTLTWPMTVKSFRTSLFAHLGITLEEQTLPNDNITLTKTITPEKLVARDVAKQIGEINGAFGHMTRDGKFKYIGLSSLGLYPSETLYPSEDLFPAENNEFLGVAGYETSDYEEYYVKPIDKLTIRKDNGDVGVSVGTGENAYVVEDNFLCYGMNATQLTEIANAMFLVIKNKYYRPHKTKLIGLPYLEVGDAVSIVTSNDAIETFIFSRTLSGIHALTDEYSATGNETRQVNNSLSSKVIQLKNQTIRIKADVDGLVVEVSGPNGLSSKIQQNSESITAEVTRAQGVESSLSSSISMQAGEISQKVSKGNVISEINQTSELIKILAARIALEGLVTANNAFFIGMNGVAGGTTFFIDELRPNSANKISVSALNCGGLEIQGQPVMSYAQSQEAFAAKVHNHDSAYASKSHWHNSSTDIMATRDTTSSTGNYDAIRFVDANGENRAATLSFVVSKIGSSSDKRLKKRIKKLKDVTDDYMRLKPVSYKYKKAVSNGRKDTCFGFLADDVESIYPESEYDIVNRNKSELTKGQSKLCPDGMLEINSNNMHALHVTMIQKHEQTIQSMLKIINEQNERIARLERGENGQSISE